MTGAAEMGRGGGRGGGMRDASRKRRHFQSFRNSWYREWEGCPWRAQQ